MVTAAIFVLINKILTIMMVGPTYTVPIRIQALAIIADTILIFVNKASIFRTILAAAVIIIIIIMMPVGRNRKH